MSAAHNAQSWIESANGHPDFPLQNLPLGVFSPPGDSPRGGVAIGDYIFDLKTACEAGLFHGAAHQAALVASGDSLNAFFAAGPTARRTLRDALIHLLSEGCGEQKRMEALGAALLKPQAACRMHLPAKVGDYTDFYVGIHHAQNVGKLFRPDNPLLPNYKYVPIGYHGRASTIVPSGTEVRRPNGQTLPAGLDVPVFGPCARMDLELELGIWIGQGNDQGKAIPINAASGHIAGFCLLNDWSARDVQAWEYQPLGPFLSKSFATTVSPWVVTSEALEPFRVAQPARPEGDPQPLPYLYDEGDQQRGALDIELEVLLHTARMRHEHQGPERIALSNTLNMYWTVAQMVAHHSVNGCRLQAGDLFGSGTLSGETPESFGSLLEMTFGGKQPVILANGEERRFLEDGDEIILRARCRREGYASIGFGECRGRILPAH
ncbi:fumarylacetoacetase [Pseudomonas sp. PDM18]|uniref:fumarylacetoacetase n=1 Tax=unclassified Pseudomonas TaxID=196821 RepID=UPI0017829A4D|nr:fumarylacetoacetase [Pseudomonas sp. PDM18]MBD9676396.1 fumarylacetoacetase [Pseudomonas sp. PDM18]